MMNRLTSPATLALALLMTLPMACGSDGGGGGNGDGGVGNGDGGNSTIDANPNTPRTAFRISKMNLRDPHVFFGNSNLTSTVDGQIKTAIETDDDMPADGFLDLNATMVFRPLDQAAATTPLTISFANCTVPLASTSCTQDAATTLIPATATNDASASCLEAIAGTTTDYAQGATPVEPVPAPCFASNSVDVTVNLGSVTLPLKSARISATYVGDPATSMTTGLLMGYVTQADADATIVPVPILGDKPLSDLLKAEDRDTSPDGVANGGWWFYLSLEAAEVTYTVE
jgi:hypothetical protein